MNYKDIENQYKKNKMNLENEITNLKAEKQNIINDYNANYNNQIAEYNNLMKQTQDNLEKQTNIQMENQNKQNQLNIDKINQAKENLTKEVDKTNKDNYASYMKQINQFGGNSEDLVSKGLATQGFNESSKVAMYNNYQNRVYQAKDTLTKANQEYDNQMQQAIINNDVALAQFTLNKLNQTYKIALQGFEFSKNMNDKRLNFMLNLDNTYKAREENKKNKIEAYENKLLALQQARQEERARKSYSTPRYSANTNYFDDSKTNDETLVGEDIVSDLNEKFWTIYNKLDRYNQEHRTGWSKSDIYRVARNSQKEYLDKMLDSKRINNTQYREIINVYKF